MNQTTPIHSPIRSGVRLRVVAAGLILAALNAYWVAINDIIVGPLHNYMSLFSNAVFTLFALILLNLIVKRLMPRAEFSRSDLFVIYVMVVTVTTVSGHPSMSHVVGLLAHPYWFATPENDWRNLFWRYIPDWFTTRDTYALSGFFLGETSFFKKQYVESWLAPMLYWSAFMFVLYFILICVNVVLRKQFTEHERLTYPITWMPLEMGRDISGFLRNKLMWAGFGIAAGISLLNGLHTLYPFVPAVPVWWQRVNFVEKPWSYAGGVLVSFQPFVIGLSYFMPLDLAFSAWFFFILQLLIRILLGAAMGIRNPYFDEQAQGGWIGLGILALWVGRRHLKRVFVRTFSGKGRFDDSNEPMRYRTAVLGIIAGLLFLLAFAYKAGLSAWVMLMFLALYCSIAIGVAKLRASLGVSIHHIIWVDPQRTMVTAFGTRAFGARNLTVLTFLFWLNRELVAHPMPNQLEAFRIAEQTGTNYRSVLWAMLITLIIGIPVTFLIYLALTYHHGAGNSASHIVGMGTDYFTRRLQTWLSHPLEPDYLTMSMISLGFGLTTVLLVMKMRFLWWPFHPVGYVMGVSPSEMSYIWCPMLVSWFLKFTILRYGGLKGYRRAIPFFAGLVLGDYTMGCIWSIISATFNVVTYNMAWHGRPSMIP